MSTGAVALTGLDRLQVPERVRQDLAEFVTQLAGFYREDLVAIIAFGSAVSGGYEEASSDVNLLVVYSDLNIADLGAVAKLSQRWLRKRRFAPRFLSVRNLRQSARYFQIDLVDMREAHVVLCGEDVLAEFEVSPSDMRWQLAHEVKRMRMRIKQQFWRAAGDERRMRAVLLDRFSSLVHLMRALLFLMGKPAPLAHGELLETAVRELGIDEEFADRMLALKTGERKARSAELIEAFSKLMETIRRIDAQVDQVAV